MCASIVVDTQGFDDFVNFSHVFGCCLCTARSTQNTEEVLFKIRLHVVTLGNIVKCFVDLLESSDGLPHKFIFSVFKVIIFSCRVVNGDKIILSPGLIWQRKAGLWGQKSKKRGHTRQIQAVVAYFDSDGDLGLDLEPHVIPWSNGLLKGVSVEEKSQVL